jgi:hypothetical protein
MDWKPFLFFSLFPLEVLVPWFCFVWWREAFIRAGMISQYIHTTFMVADGLDAIAQGMEESLPPIKFN